MGSSWRPGRDFGNTEAVIALPGFDQATATRIVDYLVAKGFITGNLIGRVALTAEGIDKLQALKLV